MPSLSRERIAAVLADRQGSGYLLTPRLVLTAAHVVTGGGAVRVVVPGGTGPVECQVVWHGQEHCDVALLRAGSDLVDPLVSADWEPVRWGQVTDLRPRTDCQAIGYPHVQHGGLGPLDSEQVIGTLKPGASLLRGGHVLDLVHTPPAPPAHGGSPWAGLSGAALFDGDLLLGVITTDPDGWQHGRLLAVPSSAIQVATGFLDAHLEHAGVAPLLQGQEERPRRTAFESNYRSYVAHNHSELRIFGLDFSRSEHAQWPLDTAYLSLELSTQHETPPRPTGQRGRENHRTPDMPGGRQRVEAALSGRPRVLLRGLAGSGKTTLVQWLAVTAARDAFGHRLGHLDDCVPFVLPLRTLVRRGELPAPAEFLTATGTPLTPPEGWVEDILRSGRALLLVDGVDEIPERSRERTLHWLTSLLAAYPDCNWVVTTRPTAVADGWLARRDFTELDLLPMNEQDVEAFVRRWHDAAYADQAATEPGSGDSERERYTERLLDALTRKRDLARLATNPLMCAMICALHRDRRTYLPDNRMDLYNAALTMLLVRRDQERDVGAPEGLEIPEEAQRQLLQEFAYWLIRNGQTEADQDTAIGLVRRLLPAMPSVAPPEAAGDVFRFLLRRSGVLREPTPQTVDFVHRTFQDYLGARAAVDAQDLRMVVAQASDQQWEDVIRMAVGHCRPEERAEMLHQLVAQGDAADDEETRTRLHLLAAASLEHATRLNPVVRQVAEERAARLVPPQDYEDAERLATAGSVVLDLLPGPDQLTEPQAVATVHTIARIGGEHAFHLLRPFRDHPSPRVRTQLAAAWSSFDSERFAEEFLSAMELSDVRVTANTLDQLYVLDRIGGEVGELELVGSFPFHALAPGLRATRPGLLRLVGNDSFPSLDFLDPKARNLHTLELSDCGGLTDYTPLSRLPLRRLVLELMPVGPDLTPVARMPELTSVVVNSRTHYGTLRQLPLPPSLEELVLGASVLSSAALDGLERWPRLRALTLPSRFSFDWEEVHHLAALPALEYLDASLAWNTDLLPHELPSLPQVQHAVLRLVAHGDVDFGALRLVFPGLRVLYATVHHLHTSSLTVDVTALRALLEADVRITSGAEVRLIGEEALTSDQSVTTISLTPDPQATKPIRRLLPWWPR